MKKTMKKLNYYFRWLWYGGIIPLQLNILSKVFYPLTYLLRKPILEFLPPNNPKIARVFPWVHTYFTFIVIPWALTFIFLNRSFDSLSGVLLFINLVYTFSFLWVFMDYELYRKEGSLYGEKRWLDGNGYDIENMNWWQKFKIAYLWNAIRNAAWNMYDVYKPKTGDRVLKLFRGYLEQNNIHMSNLYEFAVLRYVNRDGHYMDNQGDYLSVQYSVLGWSSVWYEVDGRLYYQYSYADSLLGSRISTFFCRLLLSFTVLFNWDKLDDLWSRPIWFELHFGNNERRYTFRMKIKGGLQIFEELD